MDKLQPCPFCAKPAKYLRPELTPEHLIECTGCRVLFAFDVDISEEQMIQHWNTRQASQPQPSTPERKPS